jgi:pre-mRNA-splicing factor SYF2
MADTTSPQNPIEESTDTMSTSTTLIKPEESSSDTTPDPKAALAARMARFKALQSAKETGRKHTEKEVRDAQDRESRMAHLATLRTASDKAAYKLLKSEDPDFERKRNWDYTVEESEKWDKRINKKSRNRDGVAFSDFRGEANKVYKRQIRQMSAVDKDAYAAEKAATLQRQVQSGLLELVESEDGDVFTVDKATGRINTPAEENYRMDHKPSKEAVDRLVGDLEMGERKRLELRRKRGVEDKDEMGDVTYINQKVCQHLGGMRDFLWAFANYVCRISSSTRSWRGFTTNTQARSAIRSSVVRQYEGRTRTILALYPGVCKSTEGVHGYSAWIMARWSLYVYSYLETDFELHPS